MVSCSGLAGALISGLARPSGMAPELCFGEGSDRVCSLPCLALVIPFIMLLPSPFCSGGTRRKASPAPESAPPVGVEQRYEILSVIMTDTLELLCVVSDTECRSNVLFCCSRGLWIWAWVKIFLFFAGGVRVGENKPIGGGGDCSGVVSVLVGGMGERSGWSVVVVFFNLNCLGSCGVEVCGSVGACFSSLDEGGAGGGWEIGFCVGGGPCVLPCSCSVG